MASHCARAAGFLKIRANACPITGMAWFGNGTIRKRRCSTSSDGVDGVFAGFQ